MTKMNENQRRIQNEPTADDEIFVGPDWIREGRHVDQPIRDAEEREQRMRDDWRMQELLEDAGTPPRRPRLTEEDIVARAEAKAKVKAKRSPAERELSVSLNWLLAAIGLLLGAGAVLCWILWKTL